MKADLHNHLFIGFQPEWLGLQGGRGRNLAKVLFESAVRKGIGLVAITSENFEIPSGSVHDRFGRICDDAGKLGQNYPELSIRQNMFYVSERIGKNILKLTRTHWNSKSSSGINPLDYETASIYVVNGQTIIVNEKGRRYDHLVVGSNQVPNGKDLDYTIKFCFDKGILNFLEHPADEAHFGVGVEKARKLIEKYGSRITGVEGHNASESRKNNRFSQELAEEYKMPCIAVSDAHSPEQTGAGNIDISSYLDFSSQDKFLSSLRTAITTEAYSRDERYVSGYSWLKNAGLFVLGTKVFGIGKQ